jgi:hypothetical protein
MIGAEGCGLATSAFRRSSAADVAFFGKLGASGCVGKELTAPHLGPSVSTGALPAPEWQSQVQPLESFYKT